MATTSDEQVGAPPLPEKLLNWGPTFMSRLRGEVEKVEWPNERLWALRDERLRDLIRHAKANSPWHAERLAHVDPETIKGEDLSAIPTMTKADLMSNWDEIVADRRLTLEGANSHIERIVSEGPELWLEEFVVVATGGSTGNRAVVVWHADDLLESWLSFAKYNVWGGLKYPDVLPRPARGAYIAAQSTLHISRALGWLQSAWRENEPPAETPGFLSLSPSTPIEEMVAQLNDLKPHTLTGYPSIFHKLANEAIAGRLDIPLIGVGFAGEALMPEGREALRTAFPGIMIGEMYGTSEAIPIAVGNTFVTGDYLHLQEDIGVYEPIDANGEPAKAGSPAASLLVTNVMNKVLPLIRYEVSDEVTFTEDPGSGPFTGRRITSVLGRADDWLRYDGGVELHPHGVRSILAHEPKISEYQVTQTPKGMKVLVVLSDPADLTKVRTELSESLVTAGLKSPEVELKAVSEIPRHEQTGKLKRFIALS